MGTLNNVNYLNLFGFIINVLVTFFATPILNIPDNGTLSAKYQTIITPAGFIFAIWGVIFLSQLIFTIVQMLPKYNSIEIVQEGVKSLYFYACIAQSAWTIAFGYEVIWLSVICMFLILASLYGIVVQQTKYDVGIQDFWLFKFPFQIHCAWIFAAFVLNVNLTFVAWGAGSNLQYWNAIISLIILSCLTIYILIKLERFYTIPIVFVWTTFGIAKELNNPNELIINTFSDAQIEVIQFLSSKISLLVLVGTIGIAIQRSYCTSHPEDSSVNASTSLLAG
jgi:benzodiazapine receptor